MQFKQCDAVLSGRKTQTRRLIKKGDYAPLHINGTIMAVRNAKGHLRWRVGGVYAVQPGRGQFGLGFIRIIRIRPKEFIQDISEDDCWHEGISLGCVQAGLTYRMLMEDLWNSIHKKRGTRFRDNPQVWPLTFELVE